MLDETSLKNLMSRIEEFAAERNGSLGVHFGNHEWSVSLTWGEEEPGSPMVGAQALGIGSLLEHALIQVAQEAQIDISDLIDTDTNVRNQVIGYLKGKASKYRESNLSFDQVCAQKFEDVAGLLEIEKEGNKEGDPE